MSYLHGSWDAFAVTENLVQIFCTQNISQGGLRQQPGGVVSILYVSHWHCCIGHSVINNCIDGNRHWIFGQNLMGTEKKISIRMFMLIGLIFLLVSKTSKRWRKSYVTYVFPMSRKIMPILFFSMCGPLCNLNYSCHCSPFYGKKNKHQGIG